MKRLRNKLLLSIILIILIIATGVVGYMVLEGWDFRDSLFMTVITLTTVGYNEVHNLTPQGEIFTIFLLIFGVGIIFYVFTTEAKVVLEGQIQDILGKRKMRKRIKDLKNHYIICGYGTMGSVIVDELVRKGVDLVVVEKDENKIKENYDFLMFNGDANKDEVLRDAGIERAKGLVSVLSTDAENIFVVLSARELNPDIFIISRAIEGSSENKFMRAGANRIISPYHAGGVKIANLLLKPAVVDFIEFTISGANVEMQMEQVVIQSSSKLNGITLEKSALGKDLGVMVVAIKKVDGTMRFSPAADITLDAGDTLIALGDMEKLKILEELATSSQ